MFSDDKKKGLNINPLGIRQLPDGTIDIYDIKREDLAEAQAILENNRVALGLGRKIAPTTAQTNETGSGIPTPTQDEINAISAEKEKMLDEIGSAEPVQPEKTIEQAIEHYGNLKTDITAKNNAEQRSIVRKFFQSTGVKSYLIVRKRHALDYSNDLRKGDKANNIEPTAPATFNKKISALQSFFQFLIEQDLYSLPNPFEQIQRMSKGTIKKNRLSYAIFEDNEIQQIFNPETYFKKFGHKPGLAIAPLLAYLTGARLGETTDRRAKHVLVRNGITCIEIPRSDAKSASSARIIPLSKHLEQLDIPQFLQKVASKKQRNDKLFQETETKSGFKKDMSREFAEYLDEINIKDPTKVFHSFRHTFISDMNNNQNNLIVLMKLVGHSEEMNTVVIKSTHNETYNQHETPIETLKNLADKFNSKLTPQFIEAFKDYISKAPI